MDCELIDSKLVAFHLGEPDSTVEHHLLECRPCLQAFLEIKRHEQSADALGWDPPAPRFKWRRSFWAIPAAAAVAASLFWYLHEPQTVSSRVPNAWAGTEPRSQTFF